MTTDRKGRQSLSHLLPPVVMGVIVLIVTSLWIGASDAQTSKTRKQTGTPQSKAAKARADSLTAARADSLRRVATHQAYLDSLRQVQDSLARAREDSLNNVQLRKLGNRAFGVGERLAFDISYGMITAGEAILTVGSIDTVRTRPAYCITVNVNSLPSFSWIYKVEDVYRTFVDVDAIVSHRFEQHIREGSYKRDFIAEFDQIRNLAITSDSTYSVPPYVHDIMSAFYYTRTIDYTNWKPGDTFTIQNFYKDRTYDLVVKFLGRQEQEVEAGKFRTIVVEPLVREGGLFKSEGRIVIWLSDDELKIPVRVNAKIVIGSIDTELREYSGLTGPLRSRIE